MLLSQIGTISIIQDQPPFLSYFTSFHCPSWAPPVWPFWVYIPAPGLLLAFFSAWDMLPMAQSHISHLCHFIPISSSESTSYHPIQNKIIPLSFFFFQNRTKYHIWMCSLSASALRCRPQENRDMSVLLTLHCLVFDKYLLNEWLDE